MISFDAKAASRESPREFLIKVANHYADMLERVLPDGEERFCATERLSAKEAEELVQDLRAKSLLCRLLRADEPAGSPECCWNWRTEQSLDIAGALKARDSWYNGYYVDAHYFGSYSLDGLAMALHSVANSDSFDTAIERCVNLRGDADTTSAIASQIAGAMYGYL